MHGFFVFRRVLDANGPKGTEEHKKVTEKNKMAPKCARSSTRPIPCF